MEPIKPREIIYFDCIPIPTMEGDAFFWFALDHASQFCFHLGLTRSLTDQILVDKINELLNNKDFIKHAHPFELVMYRNPHLEKQITDLLTPKKGFVSFDEERFYNQTHQFIKALFQGMSK